jgi:hypothetical protein
MVIYPTALPFLLLTQFKQMIVYGSFKSDFVASQHYNPPIHREIDAEIRPRHPLAFIGQLTLNVLGFNHYRHSIRHEVTSRLDQIRARNVALVIPGSQIVRTDGVFHDEYSITEVLPVDGRRDDAD